MDFKEIRWRSRDLGESSVRKESACTHSSLVFRFADRLCFERVDSAVDLVRRLLNTEFRRSIKTLDEAENLYKVMREAGAGDGDMVSSVQRLSPTRSLFNIAQHS